MNSRPGAHTIDLSELRLLRQALNLVDYGLVVVDADSTTVLFANAYGQAALLSPPPGDAATTRPGHGLRVLHGRVIGYRPSDTDQLRRALERSKSGLRDFLCLGDSGQAAAVAVLPLGGLPNSGDNRTRCALGSTVAESYALLVFAKQHLCDDSTMALFARERGLTSAEGQVLAQVCKGLRPAQIASNHGVRISTVRTQLRSIRMKTCSETIRELVQKVSVLPPMARQLPGLMHT
ncbi:MAG: helix-turn-helix transcriptional regulator [Burkholderiaceae bacterium]